MIKFIKYTTVIVVLLIQSCGGSSSSNSTSSENSNELTVTGLLDFYGVVNLADISMVKVQILDVSQADADSIVINEIEIDEVQSLPMQYSIPYDETLIESNYSYTISASAYEVNSSGEQIRTHITTQAYPVITKNFDSQEDIHLENIDDDLTCTDEYVPALTISVKDKVTGDYIGCGATVTLEDTNFSEIVSNEIAGSCENSTLFQGAYERSGVYNIHVSQEGYLDWSTYSVEVTSGTCHVGTVQIIAELEK